VPTWSTHHPEVDSCRAVLRSAHSFSLDAVPGDDGLGAAVLPDLGVGPDTCFHQIVVPSENGVAPNGDTPDPANPPGVDATPGDGMPRFAAPSTPGPLVPCAVVHGGALYNLSTVSPL
jgi:hypothetical protein